MKIRENSYMVAQRRQKIVLYALAFSVLLNVYLAQKSYNTKPTTTITITPTAPPTTPTPALSRDITSSDSGALAQSFENDNEVLYQNLVAKRNLFLAKEAPPSVMEAAPWDGRRAVFPWDLYTPAYNCPGVERVGRLGDGGKWVCNFKQITALDSCVVYSFGVFNEVTFEMELRKRTKCEVFTFDPFDADVPRYARGLGIQHTQAGVGPVPNPQKRLKTLIELMDERHHTHINILKLDIEGLEWDLMRELVKLPELPFDQLLVELHYDGFAKLHEFFTSLEKKGYRVFMNEVNLNPCVSKPIKPPVAFEYSFVKVNSSLIKLA